MTRCRGHTQDELDFLDAIAARFDRWESTLTRRYACVDCENEIQQPPSEHTERAPICCGWEMVEFLPAELVVTPR